MTKLASWCRTTKLARWYRRAEAFYARNRLVFQVAWGAFVTAAAGLTVFLALAVAAQQSREHSRHHEEAVTVRVACERSHTFGPPLIAFLQGAEDRLHIGALEQKVTINGKKESVIAFYLSTIPASCPSM